MTSKAVDGSKAPERYPQQHVRPGRGVPGYTGNVEVYETPVPASYQGDGGIAALKAHDNAAGGPDKVKSKYDGVNVAGLREELESRGLKTDGNRGDLVARLEDDDAAQT